MAQVIEIDVERIKKKTMLEMDKMQVTSIFLIVPQCFQKVSFLILN